MDPADQHVVHRARAQRGFVTRQQCRAAGLSDGQIRTRLASHGWDRYLPEVFLLPGIKVGVEGRLMAAQLWGGRSSILSHASAAWLHRIDASAPRIPEMYLRTGKRCPAVRCYRLAHSDQPEVTRRGGFAFTRVERTLLDLCGCWTPQRVGQGMDAALRQGLTSLDRLSAVGAQARQGRRGTTQYRELLRGRDHRDAAVRSDFETRTLRTLKKITTATVVPDFRVAAGSTYFLDFAFPGVRLGVECQSVRWHLGDEALKSDSARMRALTLAGWMILPYCWDDVVFRPQEVRREVEEAIELRSLTFSV